LYSCFKSLIHPLTPRFDEDFRGTLDRGQAVGDGKGGPPLQRRFKGLDIAGPMGRPEKYRISYGEIWEKNGENVGISWVAL
jgi:hypothetical protein